MIDQTELSDPGGSFETFLTHSRHTSSNGFSLGQLFWNTSVKLVAVESRPNLPHHSLSHLHARSLWLVQQCLLQALRTASFCPLIPTSTATSAAVLFLVPARMSSITETALRFFADFPTSCDIVSTFPRSTWKSSRVRRYPSYAPSGLSRESNRTLRNMWILTSPVDHSRRTTVPPV